MRQTKTHTKIFPQTSLQSEQTYLHQPLCVQLVLQILDHLDVSMSLMSRGAEHSRYVSPLPNRGEGAPPSTCWQCFACKQSRRLLAFAVRACCCLKVNQLIRTSFGPFLAKLLPNPHSNKTAIIIIGTAYRQL